MTLPFPNRLIVLVLVLVIVLDSRPNRGSRVLLPHDVTPDSPFPNRPRSRFAVVAG